MLPILFDLALGATLLAALGLLTLRLLRRAGSGARLTIGWLSLLLVLCAPPLGHALRAFTNSGNPAATTQSGVAAVALRGSEEDSLAPATPVPEEPTPPTPGLAERWLHAEVADGWTLAALLAGAWGLASCLCLVGHVRAVRSARHLRHLPSEPLPPGVTLALQHLSTRLGVAPPELRVVAADLEPCSLAGGRGLVLLPLSLLGKLGAAELEAVLVHELVHLRDRHLAKKRWEATLVVLHAWNPLVRRFARAFDALLEHVCDDHAAHHLRDDRAYARCLVRVAELRLDRHGATSAGILARGAGFGQRVERLLRARSFDPERPPWSAPRVLSALAILLAPAACLQSALPKLEAQDPRAPGDFFGFRAGSRWEYSSGDGTTPSTARLRVTCVGSVEIGGAPAIELRHEGRPGAWQYWQEHGDGWRGHTNGGLAERRGVAPDELRLLLALPLTKGKAWTFAETLHVQSSAGPDGSGREPSEADLLTTHSLRVGAVDETVRVAAGTFRTVRVTDAITGRTYGRGERISWYAQGVGLVREENRHERWSAPHVLELLAFVPGPGTSRQQAEGTAADPFQVFRASRFQPDASSRSVRILTATGSERFDPASPSAWTSATHREALNLRGGPGTPSADRIAVTRCVALLLGASQEANARLLPGADGSDATLEQSAGEATTGRATVVAGSLRLEIAVRFEDGEVRRIDVTPLAPARGR